MSAHILCQQQSIEQRLGLIFGTEAGIRALQAAADGRRGLQVGELGFCQFIGCDVFSVRSGAADE